jgi:hypothetical protein
LCAESSSEEAVATAGARSRARLGMRRPSAGKISPSHDLLVNPNCGTTYHSKTAMNIVGRAGMPASPFRVRRTFSLAAYLRSDQVLHHLVLIFLRDIDESKSDATAVTVLGDLFDPGDLTQTLDRLIEGGQQQVYSQVNLAHQKGRDPVEAGDSAVEHQTSATDLRGRALEDRILRDLHFLGEELVTDGDLGMESDEFSTLGETFDH